MGDIIMSLPFVKYLITCGQQVDYETDSIRNADWMNYILPEINDILNLHGDPYKDIRQSVPGYDCVINLNRQELSDKYFVSAKKPIINWQDMIACKITELMLPVPPQADMSPMVLTKDKTTNDGTTLMFTGSTSPLRALPEHFIQHTKKRIPDVIINPQCATRLELVKRIATANEVIAPDSGPIHIAEMMRTDWHCFHTTFDTDSRHSYYRYGTSQRSSSNVTCSPCYSHDTCRRGILLCQRPIFGGLIV